MSTWGVYSIQGRLADGSHTAADDRRAKVWFVRWRVDGAPRRRTFRQKGHAKTFRDELTKARLHAWAADARGWPVDPSRQTQPVVAAASNPADGVVGEDPKCIGHTVESYVWEVWWPVVGPTLEDKNRLGHRRNAELAVRLLRYKPADRRLGHGAPHGAGNSIVLEELVADDLKLAVVERRSINGRTVAVTNRRIAAALKMGDTITEVTTAPEVAAPATVRAFATTLCMIIKAAKASGHVQGNPTDGVMAFAPKPRPVRVSARLAPSVDEIFEIADVIATLGPLMSDGHFAGERFRSLILAAGTLGPRPGELVAHQPEWLSCAGPGLVRFQRTEAAVYDSQDGSTGRRDRPLKQREEDDYRDVPVIPEVADALRLHVERGYGSAERTWLSPSGRGHLDWGNILDSYWRPAMRRVFEGTAKESLIVASPKILRKAAITWWLQNGVSPAIAADWAGHSEEVMNLYYASRSSTNWTSEAELLMRGRPAAPRTVG